VLLAQPQQFQTLPGAEQAPFVDGDNRTGIQPGPARLDAVNQDRERGDVAPVDAGLDRSSACRQASEAPNTALPCACQAAVSGFRAAVLPAPAAAMTTPNLPPIPSRSIAARWALPCSPVKSRPEAWIFSCSGGASSAVLRSRLASLASRMNACSSASCRVVVTLV
jgi:hypothetical protein